MPELPEVESARAVIERKALWRPIVDVDDSDSYVSRPHPPGEIRHALIGGEFIAAMRRGKSIWCPTGPATDDVTLGIHLGMSGKIVIADPDGTEVDGGDYWEGRRQPGDYRWARFTVTFADGGRLMLVDPRRLGRIRLDPPEPRPYRTISNICLSLRASACFSESRPPFFESLSMRQCVDRVISNSLEDCACLATSPGWEPRVC